MAKTAALVAYVETRLLSPRAPTYHASIEGDGRHLHSLLPPPTLPLLSPSLVFPSPPPRPPRGCASAGPERGLDGLPPRLDRAGRGGELGSAGGARQVCGEMPHDGASALLIPCRMMCTGKRCRVCEQLTAGSRTAEEYE